MSEHDRDALDALRRLDGPAGLADGVEERIEAELLARFDERVADPSTAVDAPIVELAAEAERRRRRPNRIVIALSSAAAIVTVVGGIALLASGGDLVDPGDEPDPSVATEPQDSAGTEQLAAFCSDVVVPAREADAGWEPSGVGTEARFLVLIAVERAADLAGIVDPPLADRWGDFDERLLTAATDARLATSLGREDSDAAVEAARDLLFTVGDVADIEPVPPSCLPQDDGGLDEGS